MSASNEWWEYHLTPRGWIIGSEKTDFASTDRATPEDRVASYTYSECLTSAFSKPEYDWKQDHAGGEEEKALMAKFGAFPGPHIGKNLARMHRG